ncbi:MAG: cytochrome c biogenesis protein CcsA [Anaerolineae bacterium]|nr:cytochrome c biogenesis protein CcsA [Anaerolineae bacterium]
MAVAQGSMTTPAVRLEFPAWRSRLLGLMTALTVVGFFIMLYMALFWAGTDPNQGDAQRIFYIHVSAYVGGTTVFFVTVIAGLAYLLTRNPKWDRLALSSVEIGLPLMTITLVTGSAWARPIWNTWWTADPRLNATAVMWLLYAAYLVLRGAIENPDRRARFAAVYGILAFASVIVVFILPRTQIPTLHPVVIGPSASNPMAEGGFEVRAASRQQSTMGMAMVWYMLASLTLLWHRVRLEERADIVRQRKHHLFSQ